MQRFLEAPERREILRQYGEKYRLKTFVETGTSTGDTPWYLKDSFEVLFTIELHEQLYLNALEKFRGTRITALYGDSTVVLPKVLDSFDGPALVWLDGHHSGPGTAHGDRDTPVVQELEILFGDGRRHVILVDDARCFEHFDYPHYADYPTCEWVEEIATAHDYDYELRDDIMRLTPR
jgi:hypothetical protein